MVHIYIEGQQVAVHKHNVNSSRYITTEDHLCSHHRHYLDRSPDYYLEKAKSKGEAFHVFIREVFNQSRHPKQLYRTCEGFFSIQRKTDHESFTKARALAREYQNFSYHFLANIIKNNMTPYQEIKKKRG